MQPGQPSRTAFAAAAHRAAHQVIDQPVLLADPNAILIMGPEAVERLKTPPAAGYAEMTGPMRALIVARSLLAEETLATAVARGVRQYVVLGAGLDTFAYRNPFPEVTVYEVDYPATCAWKQAQLQQAGITAPTNVVYAAMDFETETLADALARAGFNLSQPSVFAWLGVMLYLTPDAITSTLSAVAHMAKGSEIVFDYGEPRDSLPPAVQDYMKETMQRLAAIGEPWISFFAPADMAALLKTVGFSEVEDLSGAEINDRWYAGSATYLRASLFSHVLRARV